MISLIYSNTRNYGGIKAYSLNLFRDLSIAAETELISIPKIEARIGKRKIGGWISQAMLAPFVKANGLVHSTSHWDLLNSTKVVTIHDLFPLVFDYGISDAARNFYHRKLRKVQAIAKAITVQGPHIKEQVEKYLDLPVHVIQTKVFTEEPESANPYPDDGKIHLLTMGEIMNEQNRKRIFELYEWLKDNPEIDLYHIGRIENAHYRNYARNIHQLGSVSQDAKFAYLKYADKFVFKTIGEGQGIPVMEAMKLGTQAIVNELPEHRFFLGDKPYYYETKEEFLDAIHRPDKSGQREQISQYDNWIEKYMKVYEEVGI